jgi:hypothetical protein
MVQIRRALGMLPTARKMRLHKTRRRHPGHHLRLEITTCLHVGSATVLFLSRFGVALFAKVSPKDSFLTIILSCHPALLDSLFICDACDADGVPDLARSSGRHTEEHHLIRCLEPEENREIASSTEQRLMSLEERLNDMHTRFDDLGDRIRNIEQLLHKLAGTDSPGNPE